MQSSDSIASLAKALVAAQAEMPHAVKSAENPFFKSKYADLATVVDTCRPILAKRGLAVIQGAMPGDGANVTVTCRLIHESGEWVQSALTLKPTKADPQGLGSAITYARRYLLSAILGMATEDDDGQAASMPVAAPPAQRAVAAKGDGKGNAITRESLVSTVQAWSGVQREDVASVMAAIKARLSITGELKAADYARVVKLTEDFTFDQVVNGAKA